MTEHALRLVGGVTPKLHDHHLRRQAIVADFRSAKSTHIPHRQPHRFSRNVDAFVRLFSTR